MKNLVLITLLVSANAFAYTRGTTGNPDSLKIKLYRFAVSENADCSNPQVVIDNSADPQYVSMLSQPEFGSGDISNGTYPCVMVEMSDQIKYSPDGSWGNCDGNAEYTLDVCANSEPYQKLDGTSASCSGGRDSSTWVNTKVVLYLSTNATSADPGSGHKNGFLPPASSGDDSQGFLLGNALTVSGTEVGVFDVDGTGKVVDITDDATCEFDPPSFTFSKR